MRRVFLVWVLLVGVILVRTHVLAAVEVALFLCGLPTLVLSPPPPGERSPYLAQHPARTSNGAWPGAF